MFERFRSRAPAAAGYLLLVLCLWGVFQTNLGGVAPKDFFDTFQLNGQARVLGGIVAADLGLDKQGANMGKVHVGEVLDEETSVTDTYRAFAEGPAAARAEGFRFAAYPTQFGLQEVVYAFLRDHTPLKTLQLLQLVPSGLTALVLVALFRSYRRIFDLRFSVLFFLSLALSPWFIAFARNLYWNPFLLLLPGLFAALMYRETRPWARRGWLLAIGAAMLVKCLTNYEYITCVALLAAAVFLAGPCFDRTNPSPRPDIRTATLVMLVCIAAFAVAFLIHAASRGDTLLAGIRDIYAHDVARRTYGDASQFSGEAGESLRASPLDVLRIYLLEWPDKRRMLLPGKAFLALLAIALAGLAWMFATRHPNRFRNFWLSAAYAAVPLSWYILAKGHAFTQTHLNFVLLYFGLIPVVLYLSLDAFGLILDRRGAILARLGIGRGVGTGPPR